MQKAAHKVLPNVEHLVHVDFRSFGRYLEKVHHRVRQVHCNFWFELENLSSGHKSHTHLFMAMVRGVIFGFKAKRVLRHLSASKRTQEIRTVKQTYTGKRVSRFYTIVNMAFEMHFNACQCIALPNTALLDCILCMIQAFYQALQIGVSLGTCI